MKEGWFYLLPQRDFLNGTTDRKLKIGLTEGEVEDRVKEHQTGNPRRETSEYDLQLEPMSWGA